MDDLITILDNQDACVKVSESLLDHKDFILSKLIKSLDLYKKAFNKEELDKLTYVMFDDLETYRSYIKKKYNYICADFSRGMFRPVEKISYVCIEPEILSDSWKSYKMLSSNGHEAFHYYYLKYIYKNKEDRIVWFDEGLAQNISGEYDFLIDDEFKSFFNNWKKKYIPIDNLNERTLGKPDIPDEEAFERKGVCNGYNTSYLIIRYLIETNGEEYILDLMKDRDRILEIGNSNIIEEMKEYYFNKFESKVL